MKKVLAGKEFWTSKLIDDVEIASFKNFDYISEGNKACIIKEVEFSDKISKKISNFTKDNDFLVYTLFTTVCKILSAKLLSKEKLIIWGPKFYNDKKEISLNDLIFFNEKIELEEKFIESLKMVKNELVESYKNQSFYNHEILKPFLPRNSSFCADLLILSDKIHGTNGVESLVNKNHCDLGLVIKRSNDTSAITAYYNADKYTDNYISSILDLINRVFEQVLENIQVVASNINLLTSDEVSMILNKDGEVENILSEQTLKELIEETVFNKPGNICLVYNKKHFSFQFINEKANQTARHLIKKGVKENSVVGLMFENSVDLIIAILSVIKAGGIYLPIDLKNGKERINYILNDSNPDIIITGGDAVSKNHQLEVLLNNYEWFTCDSEDISHNSCENLKFENQKNPLLNIVYTSGSTGKPKGVLLRNKGIANYILSRNKLYDINDSNISLQPLNYCFDGYGSNLYSSLIAGGKLVLLPDDYRKDFIHYKELVAKHQIDTISCVPSMIEAMTLIDDSNSISSLKTIVLAGEESGAELIDRIKEQLPKIKLINEYGPTEASIAVTSNLELNSEDYINVGTGISDYKFLICNKWNEYLPAGFQGELCISGEGIADGYLNQKELTVNSFIQNPHNKYKKLYKTGDRVCQLSDGSLRMFGRIDNQVKIRGYRVELNEIQAQLNTYKEISNCAIIPFENKASNKMIVAFYESKNPIDRKNIKDFLLNTLPEYMIPSIFIHLKDFPVNQNGKVDKNILMSINLDDHLEVDQTKPSNNIEYTIKNIIASLLKKEVSTIGIETHFHELGLDSLKITIFAARLFKELEVSLNLSDYFTYASIRDLSEYILKIDGDKNYYSIPKAENKPYYSISPAQKRIYVADQLDKDSTIYQSPEFYNINGEVDKAKLAKSLNELIERHEILRTSFTIIENTPVQKINNKIYFDLECISITKDEFEKTKRNLIKKIDLHKAPLFDIKLFELGENEYILLLNLHHILFDGVSYQLFINELLSIYFGEELPTPVLQYKDYSEWQAGYETHGNLKKQERYWVERFKEEYLPLGMQEVVNKTNDQLAGKAEVKIENELYEKIENFLKIHECTIYTFLLSVYYILISEKYEKDDIVIGVPVAGRTHPEMENLLGMFVNILPVRNQISKQETFKKILQKVKESVIASYENQDFQYDAIVNRIGFQGKNPLVETVFFMNNIENNSDINAKSIEKDGIQISNESNVNHADSRFSLQVFALESDDSVNINFRYSKQFFQSKEIDILKDKYYNILEQVIDNDSIKIEDISMFSDSAFASSEALEDDKDFNF